MQLTKEDFANALQQLLPPGEYWQHHNQDTELKRVLEGMGQELKTTHDETELNIVYSINNEFLGWKLADYQSMLDNNGIAATVFDDPHTPNHIYFAIDDLTDFLATFVQLENHRLPHTQFVWRLGAALGLVAKANICHHMRINATTE